MNDALTPDEFIRECDRDDARNDARARRHAGAATPIRQNPPPPDALARMERERLLQAKGRELDGEL